MSIAERTFKERNEGTMNTKDEAFHTQVGVINPEQKQLKLDVRSGICRANQIQMLFKVLRTNPATLHEKCEVIYVYTLQNLCVQSSLN